MSTRAVTELKKKKVSFEIVRYEHLQKGAEYAARAVDFPLERTIKTLVADIRGQYVFALMPGDRQLDLKMVARVFGGKKAAMVHTGTAERLTGYQVGGISPFGAKKRLRAVMESRLLEHESVMINAGQRGMMLKMSPADIAKTLNCKTASISQE